MNIWKSPPKSTAKFALRHEHLTEARVCALWLWEVDRPYVMTDSGMPGLRLRMGRRTKSFYFYHDRQVRGERIITSKLLGHLPDTSLAQARRGARKILGEIAAQKFEVGKRKAAKFEPALDKYIIHLHAVAAKRGKPARWAKNVEGLAKLYLRKKWGKWSLAEMSGLPEVVADWHVKLSKSAGPVSANHAARIVRATYRHATKLTRGLPRALPTSGVAFNAETKRETGIEFKDFPKWYRKWDLIESPTRKAFAMLGLLTGCRPGELARLRWESVRPKERAFVITNAKAGNEIRIPMSAAIARAFKIARDGAGDDKSEFVFPARGSSGHLTQFAGDELPVFGNTLRHVYRSIAKELKVDDVAARLLMGHSLRGVSEGYISRMMLSGGPSLRAAQRTISLRIVSLLGS